METAGSLTFIELSVKSSELDRDLLRIQLVIARALGNPVEAIQIARRLAALGCQPTANDGDLIEAAKAVLL